jgi:hypothetical protein
VGDGGGDGGGDGSGSGSDGSGGDGGSDGSGDDGGGDGAAAAATVVATAAAATASPAAVAMAAAVTATAAAATATAATRKKRDHNLEETGKRTLRLGGQVQTKILIKARREEHMGLAHGPRLSLLEFYKSQVSKPQNLSKLVESIAKTITPWFEDRLRFV